MSWNQKTVVAIGLALMLGACGGSKPPMAQSHQVTFVENYSSAEVMLTSAGIGESVTEANLDMRKSALWFLLEGGTDPLLNTPDAQFKFKQYSAEVYGNASNYITWEAERPDNQVKVTLPSGDQGWKVTRHLRVSRQLLTQFLEKKGIILSKEQLSDIQGMPQIMVLPDAPKGQAPLDVYDKNPLARHASATIESFLTARKYDVLVPKQMDQINNVVEVTAGTKNIETDQAYQIALSLGSDIYVTFAGQVENGKASVQVKAFETTTGRLLGTETGYSANRPGAQSEPLVEEAVGNALNNVLQRVNNYWADDSKKGLQYKIILKVRGSFSEDQMTQIQDEVDQVLKVNFSQRKSNVVTDKTMDYQVWADRNQFSDGAEVERAIRTGIKGAKVRRITVNKKLIMLAIDNQ